MPTNTLEDGRQFLAYLFFSIYFMNASAWSELSITVSYCSSPIITKLQPPFIKTCTWSFFHTDIVL